MLPFGKDQTVAKAIEQIEAFKEKVALARTQIAERVWEARAHWLVSPTTRFRFVSLTTCNTCNSGGKLRHLIAHHRRAFVQHLQDGCSGQHCGVA